MRKPTMEELRKRSYWLYLLIPLALGLLVWLFLAVDPISLLAPAPSPTGDDAQAVKAAYCVEQKATTWLVIDARAGGEYPGISVYHLEKTAVEQNELFHAVAECVLRHIPDAESFEVVKIVLAVSRDLYGKEFVQGWEQIYVLLNRQQLRKMSTMTAAGAWEYLGDQYERGALNTRGYTRAAAPLHTITGQNVHADEAVKHYLESISPGGN